MLTRFIVRGVVFLLGAFLALGGLISLYIWLEDPAASGGSSGQLALQFAVGLFFLLAGAGLALSVTLIPRLMRKRQERLASTYPEAPWMQRNKEWASGRMVVTPKMSIVIGCFVIGVAWNVLIGTLLHGLWSECGTA